MMRKVLDWGGYAGLAVLAAGVLLPFARPAWAGYRWWLVGAGVLLVLASLLARVEDIRGVAGGRNVRYGVNAAVMIALLLGVIGVVEALSYRPTGAGTHRTSATASPRRSSCSGASRPTWPRRRSTGATSRAARRRGPLHRRPPRGQPVHLEERGSGPRAGLAKRYGVEAYGTIVLGDQGQVEKVLDVEEEKLTNALVKVTREGRRAVYVVQGHGEHELTNTERPGFSEAAAMEKANYEAAAGPRA
jgi:hypothetical protein